MLQLTTMPATQTPAPATAVLPTAEAINGRATGALFFTGFGAVWSGIGLRGMHLGGATLLFVHAVVVAVLVLTILWLFRRAGSLPGEVLSPENAERSRRMFTAVNIIQWVSVGIAILILSVLRHPDYIAPAIAIIVGLHLLPLAWSFHYRQHYVTGAVLVLYACGCMALLPQARVAAVCAAGVGAVLLASAAGTLLRCVVALRRATVLPVAAASIS